MVFVLGLGLLIFILVAEAEQALPGPLELR
jgi:hypothetical protein